MLARLLEYYKIQEIEEKEKKIEGYLKLLDERRKWAGLTSRGFHGKAENAVVDSLGILSVLDNRGRKSVIDIGSGGGLVGIVMSIVCPGWEVLMVESSARKAAFLAETIGSLGLGNAKVEGERAENLTGRFTFDSAFGRATGELRTVAPTALGLLIPGGLYVAIKGSHAEMEVENAVGAIEASGGKIIGVEKPGYPGAFGIPDRVSLVVVKKI